MFAFLQVVILATTSVITFDINTWQESLYKKITTSIISPIYQNTDIINIDSHSVSYKSIGAAFDPADKYYYVLHDLNAVPSWLFLVKYKNNIVNELWHKEYHNGIPCNVLRGNKILLHLKTAGFFTTDIIFQADVEIKNTKYGVVALVVLDKSFVSKEVSDFEMKLWVFPHPIRKNLVIAVLEGYMKTPYFVKMLDNSIKWQVDSVMSNLFQRLLEVAK